MARLQHLHDLPTFYSLGPVYPVTITNITAVSDTPHKSFHFTLPTVQGIVMMS